MREDTSISGFASRDLPRITPPMGSARQIYSRQFRKKGFNRILHSMFLSVVMIIFLKSCGAHTSFPASSSYSTSSSSTSFSPRSPQLWMLLLWYLPFSHSFYFLLRVLTYHMTALSSYLLGYSSSFTPPLFVSPFSNLHSHIAQPLFSSISPFHFFHSQATTLALISHTLTLPSSFIAAPSSYRLKRASPAAGACSRLIV